MRGRPGCLLQSTGGEANRILLASASSSMRNAHNMPKQGKPERLDYSSEFGLHELNKMLISHKIKAKTLNVTHTTNNLWLHLDLLCKLEMMLGDSYDGHSHSTIIDYHCTKKCMNYAMEHFKLASWTKMGGKAVVMRKSWFKALASFLGRRGEKPYF